MHRPHKTDMGFSLSQPISFRNMSNAATDEGVLVS